MSHFSVMVIGGDVEEQLAPYNEDIRVPPYRKYADTSDLAWYERLYEEETGSPPPDHEALAKFLNKRWDDERYYYEPHGGIYQMTTYNPHSKWDWWVIGGRWRGYFKLKSKESILAGDALLGEADTFDSPPMFDADECQKGDIDIEGMRNLRGEEAGALWDRAQEAFGITPPARAWREFFGDILDPETGEPRPGGIDQARDLYNAQPRVKAVQAYDATLPYDERICGAFSNDVEDFQIPREEYVQNARDAALPTYAYVYEGEWFAPGKMGWFGMSSDEEADRRRFRREFNEWFDTLPDDTLVTIVDCHI